MPRNVDPGSLKTGSGKALPGQMDSLVLKDGSVVDGIGVVGYIPLGGTLGTSRYGLPQPSESDGGVFSHLLDVHGAHPAVAVSIDGHPPLYFSTNVEGALDEVMGAIPPPPPGVGQQYRYFSNYSGIPDWGQLKLRDQWFVSTVDSTVPNPESIFPLYWKTPTPTLDWMFTAGKDPVTDSLWNYYNAGLPLFGGPGAARAAAYTTGATPSPIRRTRAVSPIRIIGIPQVQQHVISGTVFPADRGVLALLHWPAGGDVAAFLAQDLLDRCIAAVLLGQGINNSSCFALSGAATAACDGGPGGIFSTGLDADGHYDAFAFPGQATGQYNLEEINTGLSAIDGSALPAPWGTPWVRTLNVAVPGAGQVRLGTILEADPLNPVKPYGIPVLGAGASAYTPPAGADIGNTILNGANFFQYRLPYLDDYSPTTGLKYTPRGAEPYTTREIARYFQPTSLYDATSTDIVEFSPGLYGLVRGGNYYDFPQDYWTWQLARYRHVFYVANSNTLGAALGSYMLLHFKTEADFEACVRDGILPWDVTDGYDLYGANFIGTGGFESYTNLVNQDITNTAPDYGYEAEPYHLLRDTVVVGDNLTPPTAGTRTFTWDSATIAVTLQLHKSSGIAYFVPKGTDGLDGFWITDISATATNAWKDTYLFDSNDLTGNPPIAPAQLSSGNPVFLGLAPFSYDLLVGNPTFTMPVGFTDPALALRQRIEFSLPYCGSNGSGAFSEANGPATADTMTLAMGGGDLLEFGGDEDFPAFSTNAVPRVFIRRPLSVYPVMPYSAAVGHGFRLEPTNDAGAKVLFHSTRWTLASPGDGHYGNFTDSGSAPANQGYATLFTSRKDVEERFLDEMYRYSSTWNIAIGADEKDQLTGPGMKGWIGGPIIVPVQAGYDTTASWHHASWTWQLFHLSSIAALPELEVAGLPDRNPPLNDWAQEPFPSAGLLLYPQKDYTTGYVPRFPPALLQEDYSACAGERSYVRCFDVGFARGFVTSMNQEAIGQPFVTVRITGLAFSHYKYNPPGPGDLGTSGVSIQVKVPGLTTWMDVGRQDGSGPSKQDALLDGAGCLVSGPYSFQASDTTTRLTYCQLQLNAGAAANLFAGIDTVGGGAGPWEVPLLVKVVMNTNALPLNLEGTGPGNSSQVVYGLVTMRVLHPSEVVDASTVPDAFLVG